MIPRYGCVPHGAGCDLCKRPAPRAGHNARVCGPGDQPQHHATFIPGEVARLCPQTLSQAAGKAIRKGENSEREAGAEVRAQPNAIRRLELLCAPVPPVASDLGPCQQRAGAQEDPAVPPHSPGMKAAIWAQDTPQPRPLCPKHRALPASTCLFPGAAAEAAPPLAAPSLVYPPATGGLSPGAPGAGP